MSGKIALIGFGEAGSGFAAAAGWDADACAFDIAPDRADAMQDLGVRCAPGLGHALADASLVLSLVTADAAFDVAKLAAPLISFAFALAFCSCYVKNSAGRGPLP